MTKAKYRVHPCDSNRSVNSNGDPLGLQNNEELISKVLKETFIKTNLSNESLGIGGEPQDVDHGTSHSRGSDLTDASGSSEAPRLEDHLREPPPAKDRGYAWVVAFNVCLINLVSAGYVKSFGITYTLIMDYFPDASGASSGWIMGLLVGCRGLLAPAMGALTVLAGPRKCVIGGALMCVAGILMAVPAFSVIYLAFSLGAVVGTGMCMAETPGFILVTDYFQEKRSLANGIRAAGNPLGGILFSPMIVLLHQEFGLRGMFMLIAGVMLQLVVFGMLMRPFELHEKVVQEDYWRQVQRDTGTSDLQIRALKATLASQRVTKEKKAIDFSILKNPAYLVYLVMVMCTACALPSALLYAPVYGRSIGLSDFENSAISAYISCCDVVMRLFCGFIFNRKKYNKRYGFIASLVIGGVGCMTLPLSSNMWHLLVFATMFSLCMAFFWTLINVLLADQFGGDAMASTWGFFRMLQGICNFFYPTVVGLVMDLTGGVSVPYIMMGSMLILGALVFASQPLVAKLPGSKIYPS
ncbi:monocarboxylate transporter 2-like [Macrobrachium nipponense]|uniref:monocarboxylate transporter 2-like n=1 Tax=Macrobrachium nipponense TaxID=159736 RepID=UPI0030C8D1A1